MLRIGGCTKKKRPPRLVEKKRVNENGNGSSGPMIIPRIKEKSSQKATPKGKEIRNRPKGRITKRGKKSYALCEKAEGKKKESR